jgi:hypothetical protein
MEMKTSKIINKQLEKFYENIKLTENQKTDAKTKYSGVCEKLHSSYYPDTQYNGNTKLLVGSYAKGTMIRPARDVDVIFIMPPEKFGDYNDNKTNPQSQLLQDVRRILSEKYPDTDISANEKVVVVKFVDPAHDVEVLPAWEVNSNFCIPNSANGGSWEYYDYRGDIRKVKDSESKTGKTKFLIRTIKKWSDNCSVQVKTYEIEIVALSFFNTYSAPESSSELLVNFFEYFKNSTNNDTVKNHLQTACNRATKARNFELEKKYDEAVEEWIKIFGSNFPKHIDSEKSTLELLTEKYPSSNEQFLDKDFNIPYKITTNYNVEIDADIEQDGFRKNTLKNFLQKHFPILKNHKLIFKAIHNVPQPYTMKWKVRNYGEEAKQANDLRGQIYNDDGRESRTENTKYYGEHYVECYIIKNGVCVAIGHTPVPIGNDF